MTPAEREHQHAIAERERVEQGLPPRLDDPVVQSKIVVAMGLPCSGC